MNFESQEDESGLLNALLDRVKSAPQPSAVTEFRLPMFKTQEMKDKEYQRHIQEVVSRAPVLDAEGWQRLFRKNWDERHPKLAKIRKAYFND